MGEEQDAQAFDYAVEPVTDQSATYQTRHERLRDKIQKLCLPDQADKVMLTVLANIQGYDERDTHRNVSSVITELASDNLGINP